MRFDLQMGHHLSQNAFWFDASLSVGALGLGAPFKLKLFFGEEFVPNVVSLPKDRYISWPSAHHFALAEDIPAGGWGIGVLA